MKHQDVPGEYTMARIINSVHKVKPVLKNLFFSILITFSVNFLSTMLGEKQDYLSCTAQQVPVLKLMDVSNVVLYL